jgi:hypothetical protein
MSNSLVGCLKELGLFVPCRRQPALPLLYTEVLLIRERFLLILDADDAVLVWFGLVWFACSVRVSCNLLLAACLLTFAYLVVLNHLAGSCQD